MGIGIQAIGGGGLSSGAEHVSPESVPKLENSKKPATLSSKSFLLYLSLRYSDLTARHGSSRCVL